MSVRLIEGLFQQMAESHDCEHEPESDESFTSADRIFQIYGRKRKTEMGKYAAIGAGVGAGAGLGIGLAKNSPPVDDGEIYPIIGVSLGAGIGAIGGFLFFYLVKRNESGYSSIRRTKP